MLKGIRTMKFAKRKEDSIGNMDILVEAKYLLAGVC